MSVTTYEIGCKYDLSKLKNQVYFLNKSHQWSIDIDNGEASATFVNTSPYPPSTNRLDGFNIKLQETESLDERYKFSKNLTMSINGHLTDASWLMEGDYYLVVQTEDGTYYIINVDFPSKMTYSYNLSEGQNQTDFTFTSNSNYPTLKFNWTPTEYTTCKTYNVYGIDKLQLLEKDYTTISSEQKVINLFEGQEFKNIDFLKNTITLQESYDGDGVETTISFDIPFDAYKSSWQYNLLEFTKNLYAAHIAPKNSVNEIWCGYEHGLQPSYQIDGSTSIGEDTKITITLVESSQWGISEGSGWTYNRDTSKKWIGVDSECECTTLGVGKYILLQEVDTNDMPTGRYKALEGYENDFPNLNIIGTFNEDIEFKTPRCTKYKTRANGSSELYTCISGDKYSLVPIQETFDGKEWIDSGMYQVGNLVESGSEWCEQQKQTKWELTNKWECYGFDGKLQLNYSDATKDEIDCDETSAVTTADTGNYEGYSWERYSSITNAIIGDCVTTIGEEAFYNCESLSSVSISNSVTTIEGWTFPYCYNLKSVVIPSNVTSIGDRAFYNCTRLTSITCLSTTPPTLGSYVFNNTNNCPVYVLGAYVDAYKTAWSSYASRIQAIIQYRWIDSGYLCIDGDKYQRRIKQQSVDNGNTWVNVNPFVCSATTLIEASSLECNPTSTSIEEYTLIYSDGLVYSSPCGYDSYTLTSINTHPAAFDSTKLISITIGNCVESISNSALEGCGSLTSCTIGNSVTSIGENAFWGCGSLTTIDIPNSVVVIGNNGFRSCQSLSSCTIGSGMTTIGGSAFTYCYSLTSITLPSGVTKIYDCAFQGCRSLNSITVYATTPPTLEGYGHYHFDETNNCPIYVPPESVSAYKNQGQWKLYKNRIFPIPT